MLSVQPVFYDVYTNIRVVTIVSLRRQTMSDEHLTMEYSGTNFDINQLRSTANKPLTIHQRQDAPVITPELIKQ